jgi:predicted flavoprotein YhiN
MTRHQVIVVGAGAAGLMAAGRAAELGAETLLAAPGENEPAGAQTVYYWEGTL